MDGLWIPLTVLAIFGSIAATDISNNYKKAEFAKAGLEEVVVNKEGVNYRVWQKPDCDCEDK